MKFTLSWLKDHLDTSASAEEIADALTHLGLELESLSNPAEKLKPFVIADVVEARQHPNADRLRVCLVSTGSGAPVQVVCGAPNARTGMKGVFAPAGAYIPGTGIELKAGMIRGEASNGMLLSERELGLSDEHEGIVDLPADAPVGTLYAAWAGLDDPVFDVGVTPNRPDALGIYGIARDLAAKGVGRLKPLEPVRVAGAYESPIGVELRFDDPDERALPALRRPPHPRRHERRRLRPGCSAACAPSAFARSRRWSTSPITSPTPMRGRCTSSTPTRCRARSTPASPATARPSRRSTARPTRSTSTMTVIADDSGPIGIGGIIGGVSTSCTPETKNVYLEAAWFDPIRTAATGRKLGINSDARYRFERGADPAFVEPGAEIGAAHDPRPLRRRGLRPRSSPASRRSAASPCPLRLGRVQALAGVEIPAEEQVAILEALGFAVAGAGSEIVADVPSWRPDIAGEADLVEEIVRVYGLDKVAHVALPRLETVTSRRISPAQRRRFLAARALASRGMNEAVTWSFVPKAQAELFGGGKPELELANPISTELSDMRPSLLPNLISAVGRNMARGFADLALFEAGQIYGGDRPQDERISVSGVRRGFDRPRHWDATRRAQDVFDAKADVFAVLSIAGAPLDRLQTVAEGPAWYHPGRVGSLMLGPKNRLAVFGEVHPRVLAAMDVSGPVVAFEIDLDAIPVPKSQRTARAALDASDLQAVTRDFAFVVAADVSADRIVRAAKNAEKTLIRGVSVFDVFAGEAIGQDRKSVAIEVTLQPRDKTLTDEDIEKISAAIVAAVTKATGGELRS